MRRYEVIEDNGGGLTLIVYNENNDGKIAFIHSGYEYFHGQLTDALEELRRGAVPEFDWDGNFLEDDDITKDMTDPHDFCSWFSRGEMLDGCWNVVADNDCIYPDRMGTSAKLEFGL